MTSHAVSVSQGSVFGPVLLIFCTLDLISLIDRQGLSPHLYADKSAARVTQMTSRILVVDFGVHQWHRWLDEVEQTTIELIQD